MWKHHIVTTSRQIWKWEMRRCMRFIPLRTRLKIMPTYDTSLRPFIKGPHVLADHWHGRLCVFLLHQSKKATTDMKIKKVKPIIQVICPSQSRYPKKMLLRYFTWNHGAPWIPCLWTNVAIDDFNMQLTFPAILKPALSGLIIGPNLRRQMPNTIENPPKKQWNKNEPPTKSTCWFLETKCEN